MSVAPNRGKDVEEDLKNASEKAWCSHDFKVALWKRESKQDNTLKKNACEENDFNWHILVDWHCDHTACNLPNVDEWAECAQLDLINSILFLQGHCHCWQYSIVKDSDEVHDEEKDESDTDFLVVLLFALHNLNSLSFRRNLRGF